MKQKQIGKCHLCGKISELTFEHFPPQKAFNKRPVLAVEYRKALLLGPDEKPSGRIQQRGMGDFTLCEACNTQTGTMYGAFYVNWVRNGRRNLRQLLIDGTQKEFKNISPLPIIKQIILFFFSINDCCFSEKHPELVEFVKEKDNITLPKKYGIFGYYNFEGRYRTSPVGATLDLNKSLTHVFSEISFPPFGYVLTFDSPPPYPRLIPLMYFSRFPYYEKTDLFIDFPILPTHLSIPGDYRTKEEIYFEAENQIISKE
ncbi:MAG: hypothetical protein GYA15_15035 [Leptolinea sp.]|nr:hypothetical protein [Leptolinea sp.]